MSKDYSATLMLKHAIDYAKNGFRVFPVHTVYCGSCSCGKKCGNQAGKHPATKNGVKDATTDIDTIKKLWSNFDYNIGLATGDGLFVLDIDSYKNGDISFDLIENDLPDTVTQSTGGGGFHKFYRLPKGVVAKTKSGAHIESLDVVKSIGMTIHLNGIDTRGECGYVIAAPSIHKSGNRYEWEEDNSIFYSDIAEIPLSFLERFDLVKTDNKEIGQVYDLNEIIIDESTISEIKSALEYIDSDTRDEWLSVGMSLHSTNSRDAFEIWDEWSKTTKSCNYNYNSQISTWKSFSKKSNGKNLESLFFIAYKNGWPGKCAVDITFVDDINSFNNVDNEFLEDYSTEEDDNKKGVDFAPSMLERISDDCPPIKNFHLWNGPVMIKGGFSLLVGEPKVGKTELILSMSMASTTGDEWLGGMFEGRPSVLWLNAEIIRPFIIDRLSKYLDTDPTDIQKNSLSRFWATAPDEFPNRIIPDLTSLPGRKWLKNLVNIKKPDIIVIDPLANWIRSVDENKSSDMIMAVGNIREATGDSSLIAAHHLKKCDVKKTTPSFDDIRGSSALRGLYDTGFLAYKKDGHVCVKFECRHASAPDEFLLNREDDGRLVPLFKKCEDGTYSSLNEISEQERIDRDRIYIVVNIILDAGGSISGPLLRDAVASRLNIKLSSARDLIKISEEKGFIESMSDVKHRQRRIYVLKTN